jgi:hypothetical protein
MNKLSRPLRLTRSSWSRSILCLCLLWLLVGACALAQAAKPITREGLEKALKLGGLKTSELIVQVKKRGVDFPLSGETQAQLTRLGAAPELLDAIAENYRGSAELAPPQPIPQPPSSFKPAPARAAAPVYSYPSAPGIYVRAGSEWKPLHQESVEWRKQGLMKNLKKASGGLMDLEATGQVAGAHSVTETHAPASFLICPPPGLTAMDYMIVHMHGKHDDREFKISVGKLHSVDQVQFLPNPVAANAFQINFAQGDGDYAIVSRQPDLTDAPEIFQSEFIYTFQVLP